MDRPIQGFPVSCVKNADQCRRGQTTYVFSIHTHTSAQVLSKFVALRMLSVCNWPPIEHS